MPPGSPKVRVLIVDDDPAVLRAVGRALSLQFQVTACDDGSAALERIDRGEEYDVIVSDLRMPAVDGVELYRRLLRTHPPLARRIVFMSGSFGELDAHEALAGLPNERVGKPVAMADLVAAIRRTLEGADESQRA